MWASGRRFRCGRRGLLKGGVAGRPERSGERGMVTAEFAVVLPAVVLIVLIRRYVMKLWGPRG